ncbi:hypothetical protein QZH41_018521, partial [Actinostola sp. cb2023]
MTNLPPIFDYFKIVTENKLKKPSNKNYLLSDKSRFYSIDLQLPTNEPCTIDKVFPSMTVKELKDRIEVETGIPGHLQRLRYLDGYDLEDSSHLSFFHVVPGAKLQVLLWPEWILLVTAACKGDYYGVLDCKIRDPFSLLNPKSTRDFNEKATVALYIAAHRGHVFIVSRLIEAGVDPVTMLPSERSPIHVAVEREHVTCVSILIGRSQGLEVQKTQHDNAIRKSTFNSVAHLLKKKRGWRKIVEQCDQRKQRQAEKKKLPFMPRKEFQRCDSAYPSHYTADDDNNDDDGDDADVAATVEIVGHVADSEVVAVVLQVMMILMMMIVMK